MKDKNLKSGKIYNLGIIGYGSMAQNHQKQLSKGNVPVRIKGVYDINPERMELAVNQGYKAYSSREELLSDEDIDICLVATTNECHKEIAIDALKHLKHVICEKPATMTSKELEEIIETAKRYKRIFTVDQNRRFNRDFINMRRVVESGALGKVYSIESRVEGSRGMPEGWRTNKAQGGGMMYDWGVHLIDQIMYMAKEKVVSVFCQMFYINYPEVEDNFKAILTFESGLTSQIEISTNNYILHPRFYVLGKEGTMIITDWDGTGKVVRKLSDDNKWEREIKKVKAGPTKTMAPRDPSTVETINLTEPEGVEDNLDPVYRQLTRAIEGEELMIKPEETLRVMKVMEACFESSAKGKSIETDI